jgi:organic hydroperoxide reductase OsmC/OhrA
MSSPLVQEVAQQKSGSEGFSVALTLQHGYRFDVDFQDGTLPQMVVDERPPLGEGAGPNPARVLATAVGQCLSASLLFCLRKARVEPKELRTVVRGTMIRNERGRFRIGELRVTLDPTFEPGDRERIGRCVELFEDFCIVTESVRSGIDVQVELAGVS